MSRSYTPRPGSGTELLIHLLRQRQVAMRTPELAEAAGLDQNTIPQLLIAAVKAGVVTCCKVEIPGKAKAMNEYRIGSGMPSLAARPELKPARPTIVPVRTAEPHKSIEPQRQDAPGSETQEQESNPAVLKAQSNDKLKICIDQDGAVSFYDDTITIDLTPAQTLALGDFLHATKNLWRP